MRKMLVPGSCENTFYAEEATIHKIYAGIDRYGNICVALAKEYNSYGYQMLMCDAKREFTNNNSYYTHEEWDLRTVLLSFVEHNPQTEIYEFDTFWEFCEWAVGVLEQSED